MRERIKQARKAKNYSQKALADKIGISDAALSKIESGVNNPARSTLISIASALNVSLKWLETGEGTMETETNSQTLDRVARQYSESKTFRAILDVYAAMDDESRAALECFIERVADALEMGKDLTRVAPTIEEQIDAKISETENAAKPAAGD